LEPKLDGSKVGLDDFFAADGIVAALIAKATTELHLLPGEERKTDALWPYEAATHGIFMHKAVGDKFTLVPLTNFLARIVADVQKDDGIETQRLFEIEARLGDKCMRKPIAAERFASLGWVTEMLGAQAIIYPGQATKDHARVAIQKLSQEVDERRLYALWGGVKSTGNGPTSMPAAQLVLTVR